MSLKISEYSPRNDAFLCIEDRQKRNDLFMQFITHVNQWNFSIFKKLGDGSAYLCSFSNDDREYKVILKKDQKEQFYNEKFGAKAIQLLGFRAPIIKSLKDDAVKKGMRETFSDFEFLEEDEVVFIMPAFDAISFRDLFESKKIEKFESYQIESIFKEFGKLAIYDLFIGNNDRLFRFTQGGSFGSTKPFFNCGNIMLDRELALLAIDNGPIDSEQLLGTFQKLFLELVRGQNFSKFAELILNGVYNHFRKVMQSRDLEEIFYGEPSLPSNFPNLEKSIELIQEGLKLGMKKITEIDQEQFCDSLKKSEKSRSTSKTLELIKTNFEALRGAS